MLYLLFKFCSAGRRRAGSVARAVRTAFTSTSSRNMFVLVVFSEIDLVLNKLNIVICVILLCWCVFVCCCRRVFVRRRRRRRRRAFFFFC